MKSAKLSDKFGIKSPLEVERLSGKLKPALAAPDWLDRGALDPTAVDFVMLREAFGVDIPAGVKVRVHDSTADLRYLVLPKRPAHTEGWDEAQLRALVTRDSMVGVSRL